jgi:hypothetical protein
MNDLSQQEKASIVRAYNTLKDKVVEHANAMNSLMNSGNEREILEFTRKRPTLDEVLEDAKDQLYIADYKLSKDKQLGLEVIKSIGHAIYTFRNMPADLNYLPKETPSFLRDGLNQIHLNANGRYEVHKRGQGGRRRKKRGGTSSLSYTPVTSSMYSSSSTMSGGRRRRRRGGKKTQKRRRY